MLQIHLPDAQIAMQEVPIPTPERTIQARVLMLTDPQSGISVMVGPLTEEQREALHRGTSLLQTPPAAGQIVPAHGEVPR